MDFSEEELKFLCEMISFYVKKISTTEDKEIVKKLVKKIVIYRTEILLGEHHDLWF